MKQHAKRRATGLILFASMWLLITSAGCGPDRPKTIPVTGQITFDSAAPPREGAIYFAPLTAEAGYPKRPGRAMFGVDGGFSATSYEDGDGLVPGEYRINVECWKSLPGPGSLGVSYVDAGFVPEDLRVSSDQRRVDFKLDVPRSK